MEILNAYPNSLSGLKLFRDWAREPLQSEVQRQQRIHDEEAQCSRAQLIKMRLFQHKFDSSRSRFIFLDENFPDPTVHDAYVHPLVDRSTRPFTWGEINVPGMER